MDPNDIHSEIRNAILTIFKNSARMHIDLDIEKKSEVAAAFDKAVTLVENTPGIVEYFTWDRQSNKFPHLTDGTDFRAELFEVASNATYYPSRARALKGLGNISTRHFDCIRSYYDLQKLVSFTVNAPHEDIRSEAITAFVKIATDKNLRPAPSTNVQSFQLSGAYQGTQPGSYIRFRSSIPDHELLNNGGKFCYDYPSRISYREAATGIAAHALRFDTHVSVRRCAAEHLRQIALESGVDKSDSHYRSLVVEFIKEVGPQQTDSEVIAVLDGILRVDAEMTCSRFIGNANIVANSISALQAK